MLNMRLASCHKGGLDVSIEAVCEGIAVHGLRGIAHHTYVILPNFQLGISMDNRIGCYLRHHSLSLEVRRSLRSSVLPPASWCASLVGLAEDWQRQDHRFTTAHHAVTISAVEELSSRCRHCCIASCQMVNCQWVLPSITAQSPDPIPLSH